MKIDKCVLIHYGELSLKGRNRSVFELKLKENIEKVTGGGVRRYRGYFILEGGEPRFLDHVPGISWYAEAFVVDNEIEQIVRKVLEEVRERITSDLDNFGVFVRRANKDFVHKSMEIAGRVGNVIIKNYGLKVNLRNPDISVFIEVSDRAYIYFKKTEGLRGFPVDVSGRVLSLISGGIDSPVSSYLMMKRGCRVELIHFHVFVDNSYVKSTKMYNLFKHINEFQRETRVHLVPYHPFETSILKLSGIAGYEVVLFRRFMAKLAERIAVGNGCMALVSGDSLGQVASQTIDNMALVKQAVSMPIFQPLITYDKQEIVDYAKKIGTYELSIEPYKDCCSIYSSKPKTKAKSEHMSYIENSIDMAKLIEKTLELVSVHIL